MIGTERDAACVLRVLSQRPDLRRYVRALVVRRPAIGAHERSPARDQLLRLLGLVPRCACVRIDPVPPSGGATMLSAMLARKTKLRSLAIGSADSAWICNTLAWIIIRQNRLTLVQLSLGELHSPPVGPKSFELPRLTHLASTSAHSAGLAWVAWRAPALRTIDVSVEQLLLLPHMVAAYIRDVRIRSHGPGSASAVWALIHYPRVARLAIAGSGWGQWTDVHLRILPARIAELDLEDYVGSTTRINALLQDRTSKWLPELRCLHRPCLETGVRDVELLDTCRSRGIECV